MKGYSMSLNERSEAPLKTHGGLKRPKQRDVVRLLEKFDITEGEARLVLANAATPEDVTSAAKLLEAVATVAPQAS